MGYIMPTDRYQYINYQERIREDRLSVSPVARSFRTVLDRKYTDVSNEYDRKLASTYERVPVNPRVPRGAERAYAEITGSGRNINEAI